MTSELSFGNEMKEIYLYDGEGKKVDKKYYLKVTKQTKEGLFIACDCGRKCTMNRFLSFKLLPNNKTRRFVCFCNENNEFIPCEASWSYVE
jgi:hypothetical protein